MYMASAESEESIGSNEFPVINTTLVNDFSTNNTFRLSSEKDHHDVLVNSDDISIVSLEMASELSEWFQRYVE